MADYLNRILNQNQESEAQFKSLEVKRLRNAIQKKLPAMINNEAIFGVNDPQKLLEIKGHMKTIVTEENTPLKNYEVAEMIETLLLEITSLGKLSPLIEDGSISEIMINACNEIWVERKGEMTRTNITYDTDDEIYELAQRIARNVGRLIDITHPMVDARLPDGSRVNIIIPPNAVKGTTITIRKFFKEKIGIKELIEFGTLTPEMARFLQNIVKARANILVSGGTGSGKTTTLNVISNFITGNQRIISIEDSKELQLNVNHLVALETKDANSEGRGAVTVQDLLKNALRMYPKRIIIGELRDFTAYFFLQAANTGHEGSMSTVHANSPNESISRMASLVMEGGIYKDELFVRKMVGNTIDVVVQISKMIDNKRRIEFISEVVVKGDMVTTVPIYEYYVDDVTDDNKVVGLFRRTDNPISEELAYKFRRNGVKIA